MRVSLIIIFILFLPCVNPGWFDWLLPVAKVFVSAWATAGTVIGGAIAVVYGGASPSGYISNCITSFNNLGNSVKGLFEVQEKLRKREAEKERNAMEQKRREENNKAQNENIDNLNKQMDELEKRYIAEMDKHVKTLSVHRNKLNGFIAGLNEFDIEVAKSFGIMKDDIADLERHVEESLMKIYGHATTALKHFDYNVAHQFRALSNLKIDLQFTEEIMLEVDLLERLMVQTMRFSTEDTNREFIEQYKVKGPRQLILDLSNRLKYKYTNYIASAMELNIFKSRQILDRWNENIGQIVFKLLTIEGFYFGLVEYPKIQHGNISLDYYDPTIEIVKSLKQDLDTFRETFTIDPDAYWPDLVSYNIEEILKQYSDRDTVADEIEMLLGQIYTRDVFTIHVAGAEDGNFENIIHGVMGSTNDKPIDVEGFYAASPMINGTRKAIQPQLTFVNPSNDLAISVVRSVSHYRRTENDKFMINEIFHNTIPPVHSSLSNHGMFGKLLNKMNEELEGDIGGAVLSKRPIAERITNGAGSALNWHNQVPGQDEYVSVMWI